MLFLLVLLLVQLLLGALAVGATSAPVAHDAQLACLTVGAFDARACAAYFASTQFAGTALVWQSYYAKSATDGAYRTVRPLVAF